MRHLNENYSNSNSVAVLSTSTHETSKVKVYEHPYLARFVCLFKTVRLGFAEQTLQHL